jgi:hypothetical protein
MATSNPARLAVDWGAIEDAYRDGLLSVREIAASHGVSHTAIAKRAAKSKWKRDVQAPKAKLVAISPATSKPAPSKPARLPVDWELVEKEHRLGKYSVRELGKRHGVGHQSILRRAAKEGWTQDKAHEVNRRVAERLLLSAPPPGCQPTSDRPGGHADHRNGDCADGPADASRKPRVEVTADDVEAAVEERVAVLIEHQKAGRDFRLIISSLGRELQETTAKLDEIRETIDNETDGDAARRARMLRAISLPSRAQSAAVLTGALKNAVGIERQAHNLDAEAEKDAGGVIVNVVKFGDMLDAD